MAAQTQKVLDPGLTQFLQADETFAQGGNDTIEENIYFGVPFLSYCFCPMSRTYQPFGNFELLSFGQGRMLPVKLRSRWMRKIGYPTLGVPGVAAWVFVGFQQRKCSRRTGAKSFVL